MSIMSEHIRRELELIGEGEPLIEAFEQIGNLFISVADSGGSAGILTGTLFELLQFKNLSPLTDNPSEWSHHDVGTIKEPRSLWQNIRNGEAFSADGGKTYWLLSDGSYDGNVVVSYNSRSYAEMMAARAMDDVLEVPKDEIASDYQVPEDPMDLKVEIPVEVPD